jgi:hypothetical protein
MTVWILYRHYTDEYTYSCDDVDSVYLTEEGAFLAQDALEKRKAAGEKDTDFYSTCIKEHQVLP